MNCLAGTVNTQSHSRDHAERPVETPVSARIDLHPEVLPTASFHVSRSTVAAEVIYIGEIVGDHRLVPIVFRRRSHLYQAKSSKHGMTARTNLRGGQWLQTAWKHQCVLIESPLQAGDELAAKHTAQYFNWKKEGIARVNPLCMISRQTAGPDNTLNVRTKPPSRTIP